MFERFSDQARQVVVLAQDEARILKHHYIGSEHLLLGILREEQGLGASVLESHGVSLERVRALVVQIVGLGTEIAPGQIPFTPRAKQALETSLREALALEHNYIGTEHLLLGVLAEPEGVAVRIVLDLGADRDRLRHQVIGAAGHRPPPDLAGGAQPLPHPIPFSRSVGAVLRRAEEVARAQGGLEIRPSHMREALDLEAENGPSAEM